MEIIQKVVNEIAYDNSKTKLNIGCGFDKREGFINVDLNKFHEPDIVADACDLKIFPNEHFEYIVAQDVLEHIERAKTSVALAEWSRICKSEGRISLRIPSLLDMLYLLAKPENRKHEYAEKIVHLLYGTQAYTGDYHLAGFTAEILVEYLGQVGFLVSKAEMRDEWLYDIEARKTDYLIDDIEFLHNLYYTLLGRPIDKGALEFYSEEMRLNKITRNEVQNSLIESKEYKIIQKYPRYLQMHIDLIADL